MTTSKKVKVMDVNQGVEEFRKTSGAALLDVRTRREYEKGCIAGSKNIPLQQAADVLSEIPDKDTPIFVYCLSGGRSRAMAVFLQESGYEKVVDLGGIGGYKGELI